MVFAAVGLGFMLVYCRAFATGFGGNLPMSGQPEMPTFAFACSAVRVVTIIVLVALGCIWRVSVSRLVLAVSGAAMAASALALSSGLGLAEGMPFALLAGVGSGVVMLATMMFFSSMGIRDIVIASFGGLLLGGAVIGGLMRLDAVPALVLLIVAGLVSGLYLLFADPQLESCRADGIPRADQLRDFPWFAAIAFAIGGFAASLLYGASLALGWNIGGQVNYPLFGLSIVVVLGASAYVVLQGEEAIGAAWLPLFIVLLLAMMLACYDEAELAPSVEALLFAAVFTYHFLRWMVFPALISFSGVPRMLVCGIALVVTSSFFGVGWGESTALALPESLHDQGSFVAFVAMSLIVVLAAALWVNRARLESSRMQLESITRQLDTAYAELGATRAKLEEMSSREDTPETPPTATIDQRCENLAQENGLTAREAEILLLTARGHSSTFIAEKLFISASTVRFHQQNIYRKLDVHSRQQLLALVNTEETSQ